MAGLESLTSLIYHEKQQAGSMLCAQHALNSLLQGSYFTTLDLSKIAASLDALEASYDDANMGTDSTNMDDTGFFSVQVLENALNVWDLTLVRWRSEQMRPYQKNPHTQLAFILNLQQHWFTLRRFGHAESSMDADTGNGHWFNLNSYLPAPEWVSKLYLDMVLQQAETEGYSVFAVVQTDSLAPLALSRTDIDEVASTLPEPTHSSSSSQSASSIPRLSTMREATHPSRTASAPAPAPTPISTHATSSAVGFDGFEDEDMELQAALQASLMESGEDFVLPLSASASGSESRSGTRTGSRSPTRQQVSPPMASFPPFGFPPLPPPAHSQTQHDYDPADPVAASMARNRRIMEHMRREQEIALREQYEEEAARVANAVAAGAGEGEPPTRMRGQREQEEEDEMLRRAIQESRLLVGEGTQASSTVIANPGAPLIVDDSDDSDDEETDADYVDAEMSLEDEEYRPPIEPIAHSIPISSIPLSNTGLRPMQPLPYPNHRVYDDDDAELQAALKASLENVPEGFTIPDIPSLPRRPAVPAAPPSSSASVPMQPSTATSSSSAPYQSDHDDVASEADTSMETSQPPKEQTVSVDEMRRRRLARFGG